MPTPPAALPSPDSTGARPRQPAARGALARFLPELAVRELASREAGLTEALEQRFWSGVMLADISGFTALSERLARQGPEGPELLTRALNAFFGPLISRIRESGGDVIKFAGDALVVVWPSAEEDLADAALRAAACGLALQRYAEVEQPRGEKLRLKVTVGAGAMRLQHIGGFRHRWELLLTGEGLSSLAEVTPHVESGQVVLTPGVRRLVGDRARCQPWESGFALQEVVGEVAPVPAGELAALPPVEVLERLIPEAVAERYTTHGDSWLSELRPVSVLFINFPNATYQTPLARAQAIMLGLQNRLSRFDGTVNKISVDEKGVSVVAVFGTPPHAHPDDPARAVRAARAIAADLRANEVVHAIGVATGPAFCGVVGSELRGEYTVLGDTVNLAARLMQQARDDLLCDPLTAERAMGQITFDELPPRWFKGKADPLPVFRPTGEVIKASASEGRLLGRDAELARLAEMVRLVRTGGVAGSLVIEGEAGLGKSRLIQEAVRLCDAEGLIHLDGGADPLERETPYFAWRPVFEGILGLPSAHPAQRTSLARESLTSLGLVGLGPLLNPLLSLDLPETPETRELDGTLRGENTRELLLRILAAQSERGPGAVLLEDAHWFDRGSWWIAARLRDRAPRLCLVLTTRQPEPPVPPELETLSAQGNLKLVTLLPADALAIACRRLEVDALPEAAAAFILERGGGHPYFTEELAYALRDSGQLRVQDGKASFEVARGGASELPPTIHGVITQRVDRLPPELQVTLKTASVVGRTFGLGLLRQVHPQPGSVSALEDQLQELSRLDLTPVDRAGPDPVYSFKHAITQEAVYGMVLASVRRELHGAVGAWYEREFAAALAPHGGLLAHHWKRAGDTERARAYLEMAGEEALRAGSPADAAGFLSQAIAMEVAERDTRLQRVHRRRMWGEALLNSGRLEPARAALDEAVALGGASLPRPGARWGASLLSQAGRQVAQRWVGLKSLPPGADAELAAEAARAHERLAEVRFFQNHPEDTLLCTLASVNLSERANLRSELARVYASLVLGTSLLRLDRVAGAYERLADLQLASRPPSPVEGWARMCLGMAHLGRGAWDTSRAHLDRAQGIFEQLGDARRVGECRMLSAPAAWLTGDITGARAIVDRLVDSAKRTRDPHMIGGSHAHLGFMFIQEGNWPAASACLEESMVGSREVQAVPEEFYGSSLMALCKVRQGLMAEAKVHLDHSLGLLSNLMPSAVYAIEGYWGLARAALELRDATSADAREVTKAVRAFSRFAKTFPIARPRSVQMEAELALRS